MSISTSLIALVLLGQNGPDWPASPISYQIRMLEMKGLDWRGKLHAKMTPVARQGNACVWSVSGDVAAEVTSAAERVTAAPRVTSKQEFPATVRVGQERSIVADFKRVADGPVDHATAVAFQPEVRQVDEFMKFSVSARVVEDGVLANISLEDSHVSTIHTFTIKESVPAAEGGAPSEIKAQVQVPELVGGKVEGEWVIPQNGALIVSLGAHSGADERGKSVVRERLAVIEAKSIAPKEVKIEPARLRPDVRAETPLVDSPTLVTLGRSSPVLDLRPQAPLVDALAAVVASKGGFGPPPLPPLPPLPMGRSTLPAEPVIPGAAEVPPVKRGAAVVRTRLDPPLPSALATIPASEMPVPPSRALPVPRAADGSVIELPPLPQEDLIDDTAVSAEPRPAPQTSARTVVRVRVAGSTAAPAESRSVKSDIRAVDIAQALCDALPVARKIAQPCIERETTACRLECCDDHALPLTLKEAVETSLKNSQTARVVDRACPDHAVCPADPTGCTVVAFMPGKSSPESCRSDLLAHLRAVEQQYWALHQARAKLRACETANKLTEEILKREEAKLVASATSKSDVSYAHECFERCQLDVLDKQSECRTIERQLRNRLGMCPDDARSVVLLSKPSAGPLDERAECRATCHKTGADDATPFRERPFVDMITEVVEGPGVAPISPRMVARASWEKAADARTLARVKMDLENGGKLYEAAVRLRNAAAVRLEAQRACYESGTITVDRYLEAVRNWACAVGQEAEFASRYSTSLACRDEVTGHLLDHWRIAIASPAPADVPDTSAARASYVSPANNTPGRTITVPLKNGNLIFMIRLKPASKAVVEDCDSDCPAKP